jgi:hypothetical protein
MSLDPKVRQSLAAVSGESVAMCFGRDLRAVLAALDEAERERDAITRLMVEPEVYVQPPGLFAALLPDRFSPLGFSWLQDVTEAEAIAAVRKAAGLED